MSVDVQVSGFCPMGCGETLELSIRSGEIRCTYYNEETDQECPQPYAVSHILSDPETEHVVDLKNDGGWTLKHPLRERLGDGLFGCNIAGKLRDISYEISAGRWRTKDGWSFERID